MSHCNRPYKCICCRWPYQKETCRNKRLGIADAVDDSKKQATETVKPIKRLSNWLANNWYNPPPTRPARWLNHPIQEPSATGPADDEDIVTDHIWLTATQTGRDLQAKEEAGSPIPLLLSNPA